MHKNRVRQWTLFLAVQVLLKATGEGKNVLCLNAPSTLYREASVVMIMCAEQTINSSSNSCCSQLSVNACASASEGASASVSERALWINYPENIYTPPPIFFVVPTLNKKNGEVGRSQMRPRAHMYACGGEGVVVVVRFQPR